MWCGPGFGKPGAANFTEGLTVGYAEMIGKRQLFVGWWLCQPQDLSAYLPAGTETFFSFSSTRKPNFLASRSITLESFCK